MDRLYSRLPAIYRSRDAEQGYPLRALLAILEEDLLRLEQDIGGLYDDWFIETCQEWVVPYIGDLLGVRGLNPIEEAGFSQRGYVANTLAYRRRKGTAFVLEEVAQDASGWPARVVEFFQLLATTQNLNHRRPFNVRTPDLRGVDTLKLLDGPFDAIPHTADVRPIDANRGRHNIPNVGLYIWKLDSYRVERGAPRPIAAVPDGRYTFQPLGVSAPLFVYPETEPGLAHLAAEGNVPGALRRLPLYRELEDARQAIADGATPAYEWFDSSRPVFSISVGSQPVPREQIEICRLPDEAVPAGWRRPAKTKDYVRASDGAVQSLPIALAVDPELGRIAFPVGVTPAQPLQVTYCYGFSGDLGGGPYDRQASLREVLDRPVDWQAGVGQGLVSVNGEPVFSTLADAVAAWNQQPTGICGMISITDSRLYAKDLTGTGAIVVPSGSRLLLVAASWPELPNPDLPGGKRRVPGKIAPSGLRPHVRGDVSVRGTGTAEPGELIIDGLLIEGTLAVETGSLGRLRIAHSTVVQPAASPAILAANNPDLKVEFVRAIAGRAKLDAAVPAVSATDTVFLAPAAGASLEAPGASARLDSITAMGEVSVKRLEAGNCLFVRPVRALVVQDGCVRFSYVPLPDSRVPRRYKCQPDVALARRARELKVKQLPQAETNIVMSRTAPMFTSSEPGQPGFAQLSNACPDDILRGAEDGAELGAFHYLKRPQRADNLRLAVAEYIRLGLVAGAIEES